MSKATLNRSQDAVQAEDEVTNTTKEIPQVINRLSMIREAGFCGEGETGRKADLKRTPSKQAQEK